MSSSNFSPNWFSKPGHTIAALMARRSMDFETLTDLLGGEHSVVDGLLSGTTDINDELAILLSKSLGGTVKFWQVRQRDYHDALERLVKKISPEKGKEWLRVLPINEMVKAGWIANSKGEKAIRDSLNYFDVTDPKEWREKYTAFANSFSYRTSQAFETKLGALAAWLRQGELRAERIKCAPWDPDRLILNLNSMRELTRLKRPAAFIPSLQAYCADSGIALVFVRAPSGCRASGAARFLSSKKAMIIISFRYLTDDHFWFSLFHEVGHLLLHRQAGTFIDGRAAAEGEMEAEANAFSSAVLIPHVYHDKLNQLRIRMKDIVRFAVSIGISPGIVVGQLQHQQLIGPGHLNHLKRRYDWSDIQDQVCHPMKLIK